MKTGMRLNFQLLLLCISVTTHAQDGQPPLLNIGDKAPPLRVREWLKGKPVESFQKGKVYVVEFWATWCVPCRAEMPRLSKLARKYKHTVTFIGMDVYENIENMHTPLHKVKRFVDSMGRRMKYHVATEDSNFMETNWMFAAGEKGIPLSFVVNAEGRLAWIGHPANLSKVLSKIVNNSWGIKDALATRILNKNLAELDDSFNFDLVKYKGDEYRGNDYKGYGNNPNYIGEPDSVLFLINKIIQNEPKLKYAPLIAGNTFMALLKTDLDKAYEYGKVAIVTPTYEDAAYDAIIDGIRFYTDHIKLPLSPEIYELGAEAYQERIDHFGYPEIANKSKYYNKMAAWYWLANDKSKAIHAERKAIKALKRSKYFSKTDLTALKLQLKEYKRDARHEINVH